MTHLYINCLCKPKILLFNRSDFQKSQVQSSFLCIQLSTCGVEGAPYVPIELNTFKRNLLQFPGILTLKSLFREGPEPGKLNDLYAFFFLVFIKRGQTQSLFLFLVKVCQVFSFSLIVKTTLVLFQKSMSLKPHAS